MGKGNNPFQSFFSYVVGLMALFPVAGCGVSDPALMLQSGRTFGLVGLEGRWLGEVSPSVANCGARSIGSMSIGHGKFAFDPFQSTSIIRGNVADDQLTGRLEKLGGEKRVTMIVLKAQAISTPDGAQLIRGKLESGPCQWQVELHRG